MMQNETYPQNCEGALLLHQKLSTMNISKIIEVLKFGDVFMYKVHQNFPIPDKYYGEHSPILSKTTGNRPGISVYTEGRYVTYSMDLLVPEAWKFAKGFKIGNVDIEKRMFTASYDTREPEADRAHNLIHPIEVLPFLKPDRFYANTEMKDLADLNIYVKFFTPWTHWTWYAYEYNPEDRIFFGLVDGFEMEFGSFSLDELDEVVGPVGLRIERDLHFGPKKLRDIAPDRFSRYPKKISDVTEPELMDFIGGLVTI
ncbi:MAG: DUF2958 domain-containing protein [Candidatus Neomarinimicrobiota bacterium]